MKDDATRARASCTFINRCGRRVKRRAINQWRLRPVWKSTHVVARVSAVSSAMLFKAFVARGRARARAGSERVLEEHVGVPRGAFVWRPSLAAACA